jgi:hypothetical protein
LLFFGRAALTDRAGRDRDGRDHAGADGPAVRWLLKALQQAARGL